MTDRLVGDATPSWLYHKKLDYRWEAQELADIIYDCCSTLADAAKPVVEVSGMYYRRLHGRCWQKSGRIVLHAKGMNYGTMAHELAHLVSHGHGVEYKATHKEIVDFMESITSRP